MDEFKQYVQANKSKLELDEPQPFVWDKIIAAQSPTPPSIRLFFLFKWALAACFIALAGMGLYVINAEKKTMPPPPNILAKQTAIKPTPNKQLISSPVPETLNRKNSTTVHHTTNTIKSQQKKTIEPILHDLETGFVQVINQQKARISTTPMYAESPEYFSDFKQQLKEMELEEKNIKSNILKQGLDNNLLDKLINLYQQKLTILKQLQLEMNKTNNQFKQNRGPVDATRNYFLSL